MKISAAGTLPEKSGALTKAERVKRLALAAMFVAAGLTLPFLTGQLKQLGNMLLPMHIPVLLCGFICGWQYGAAVGLMLPIFRSLLFSMPVMYPNAVSMAAELAVYGFLTGFLYSRSRWQCVVSLYRCLITAMLAGRIAWGVAQAVLLGVGGKIFTWQAFAAGALFNAVPGIIIQLILIPAVMVALNKTGLVRFRRSEKNNERVFSEEERA